MNFKNEEDRISAYDDNGHLIAKAEYCARGDGVIDITHVYTDPALRGQGIAGRLMEHVLEFLRENKLKSVASCSYANSWLKININRCSDVLANGDEELPIACRIDGEH